MTPTPPSGYALASKFRFERCLTVLLLTALSCIVSAIWAQPLMADDWYLAWFLADYGSVTSFVTGMYFRWGGRVLTWALAGMALSSETATYIFKLLTVPCFALLSGCVNYLAKGSIPRLGSLESYRLLLVTALLWLALPVPNETMIQISGATAYLWPVTSGVFMLCLLRRTLDQTYAGGMGASSSWVVRFGWLGMGIVVGTGNEQLVAVMTILITGWGWMLWRDGCLRSLPLQAWWGIAGLLIGAAILVAAPGNYARLDAQAGTSGALSTLFRFTLYLGGAYFGLGTGDLGRALWLGICIIVLTGAVAQPGRPRIEAGIWLAASFTALAAMLPLVNFASPRTTFLPIICLVVAALTLFPQKDQTGLPASRTSAFLLVAVWMLVAIDGFVGWTANRSLSAEMAARLTIIQAASASGQKSVAVPYLATVPSRLTFLSTPEHDGVFVSNLAARWGVAKAHHDATDGAPKPLSLNPLKALKNSF